MASNLQDVKNMLGLSVDMLTGGYGTALGGKKVGGKAIFRVLFGREVDEQLR